MFCSFLMQEKGTTKATIIPHNSFPWLLLCRLIFHNIAKRLYLKIIQRNSDGERKHSYFFRAIAITTPSWALFIAWNSVKKRTLCSFKELRFEKRHSESVYNKNTFVKLDESTDILYQMVPLCTKNFLLVSLHVQCVRRNIYSKNTLCSSTGGTN